MICHLDEQDLYIMLDPLSSQIDIHATKTYDTVDWKFIMHL